MTGKLATSMIGMKFLAVAAIRAANRAGYAIDQAILAADLTAR